MNKLFPNVDNRSAISSAGNIFDPVSRKWRISRDNLIYLSWVDDFLHPSMHSSYLSILRYYAEKYSAGHTSNLSDRFREFARYVHSVRGLIERITANDLINYRSTLDREHEWYLGALRGFLKSWIELGYSGIDEDVPSLLDGWRLRGNIKGRAVQILSPTEGPLSDLEFEALHQALIDGFECDEIRMVDFALVELFVATGRRPAQIGDLKAKDFVDAKSKDGLKGFLLNVPRRKQRGVKWREQFKAFALGPEIGVLLKGMVDKNRDRLRSLTNGVPENSLDELPIFPNWDAIELHLMNHSGNKLATLLETEEFHQVTNDIRGRLDKVVLSLQVPSERTGESLRVFPTRLRRTLATRAAREGYGELIIAELLDHSDTQNARVYTENVPEHVDAINEAVARQLAPLAQAFAGVLVDRESDAMRGDDLSSRIKSEQGCVGTCGSHAFCGALGPIACYTCRQFQPWLDAPHQDVFDALLLERARILEITQDKTMAAINDRTIIAVTEVIQRCEAR